MTSFCSINDLNINSSMESTGLSTAEVVIAIVVLVVLLAGAMGIGYYFGSRKNRG